MISGMIGKDKLYFITHADILSARALHGHILSGKPGKMDD
jgi:hypothetical protein